MNSSELDLVSKSLAIRDGLVTQLPHGVGDSELSLANKSLITQNGEKGEPKALACAVAWLQDLTRSDHACLSLIQYNKISKAAQARNLFMVHRVSPECARDSRRS
jgi:hypothetical protein